MLPSIYYPSYAVRSPKYWLVRDESADKVYFPGKNEGINHASLLFHVSQNDYFSTLATILRFYEESINDKNITPQMRDLQLKTIKDVMSDLLFLNKNYIIAPKNK